VDSFQGHEADLVFLSYSNRHPTCFLEAPNRLNVAITRARYMMVHVGDRSAMSKGQGALGRLVQKITNLENL
jgi:superfamily I DNA and/or RNA helicase